MFANQYIKSPWTKPIENNGFFQNGIFKYGLLSESCCKVAIIKTCVTVACTVFKNSKVNYTLVSIWIIPNC